MAIATDTRVFIYSVAHWRRDNGRRRKDLITKEIRVMKMKRMGRLCFGIMMLIFVMGTAAMAQDEPVFSADISVDYATRYVWRGQQLTDGSVLQPGVAGSAYGFTGSIWANIDMVNVNYDDESGLGGSGEFSEIDYALDYSGSIGDSPIGYSVGVIHYLFPQPALPSTTEIYFGASVDTLLSPFITYYRDVNNADAGYLQFGVGQSFEAEMAPDYSVGLDLSASFGFGDSAYNNYYFGVNGSKWNDLSVGIGVPFNLKHVSLTPSLNISTLLSDAIGEAGESGYGRRTNVWFALSLGKSF